MKRLLSVLLVLLISVGVAYFSIDADPNSPIFRPATLASLALVAGALLLFLLYRKERKPLIYIGKHYDLGLAFFYVPFVLRFFLGLAINGLFLISAENAGERIVTAIAFCMQIPLAVLMFRGYKAFPAAYIASSSITISMYFALVSGVPAALFLLIDPSLIMRLFTSPIASARYRTRPVYVRMRDGSLAAFSEESYRAFVNGHTPVPAASQTTLPSTQTPTIMEAALPPAQVSAAEETPRPPAQVSTTEETTLPPAQASTTEETECPPAQASTTAETKLPSEQTPPAEETTSKISLVPNGSKRKDGWKRFFNRVTELLAASWVLCMGGLFVYFIIPKDVPKVQPYYKVEISGVPMCLRMPEGWDVYERSQLEPYSTKQRHGVDLGNLEYFMRENSVSIIAINTATYDEIQVRVQEKANYHAKIEIPPEAMRSRPVTVEEADMLRAKGSYVFSKETFSDGEGHLSAFRGSGIEILFALSEDGVMNDDHRALLKYTMDSLVIGADVMQPGYISGTQVTFGTVGILLLLTFYGAGKKFVMEQQAYDDLRRFGWLQILFLARILIGIAVTYLSIPAMQYMTDREAAYVLCGIQALAFLFAFIPRVFTLFYLIAAWLGVCLLVGMGQYAAGAVVALFELAALIYLARSRRGTAVFGFWRIKLEKPETGVIDGKIFCGGSLPPVWQGLQSSVGYFVKQNASNDVTVTEPADTPNEPAMEM